MAYEDEEYEPDELDLLDEAGELPDDFDPDDYDTRREMEVMSRYPQFDSTY